MMLLEKGNKKRTAYVVDKNMSNLKRKGEQIGWDQVRRSVATQRRKTSWLVVCSYIQEKEPNRERLVGKEKTEKNEGKRKKKVGSPRVGESSITFWGFGGPGWGGESGGKKG